MRIAHNQAFLASFSILLLSCAKQTVVGQRSAALFDSGFIDGGSSSSTADSGVIFIS
ncbi:MAG: hypothetical protein HYR96_03090 [Deltaproteobacteria bacterium]|nr:hypothetical protein [Deltaproteobacteria bacterium]MBI3294084.1 hypothetical protein [Deltaproteobacteria bacterium]